MIDQIGRSYCHACECFTPHAVDLVHMPPNLVAEASIECLACGHQTLDYPDTVLVP